MDKETLILANVDYENGKNRFAGNEALYHKYLLKFKEDKHFANAKKAYQTGDYEQLLKETHALKGVAGTLGLLDIYHASADIVTAIRTETTDTMPEMFAKLESSYNKIIEILK